MKVERWSDGVEYDLPPLRCLWGPNRVSAIHFGPSLPNIFPVRQLTLFLLPIFSSPPSAVVSHGHRKERTRPERCQLVQHCCRSVHAPVAELFAGNSYFLTCRCDHEHGKVHFFARLMQATDRSVVVVPIVRE